MRVVLAVLIVASLALGSSARADDRWDDERRDAPREGDGDTSVWSRWLAIDGHVGVGTPYGFGGVSIEATPIAWWTFGGGVGMSYSGAQTAVSSRVRYPWGHSAIAAGVGFSRGPYGVTSMWDDFGWTKHWSAAYWVDVDVLSVEHRWSSGRELRFYLGVASLLNPGDGVCGGWGPIEHRPACENKGTLFPNGAVPYFGFAYGVTMP